MSSSSQSPFPLLLILRDYHACFDEARKEPRLGITRRAQAFLALAIYFSAIIAPCLAVLAAGILGKTPILLIAPLVCWFGFNRLAASRMTTGMEKSPVRIREVIILTFALLHQLAMLVYAVFSGKLFSQPHTAYILSAGVCLMVLTLAVLQALRCFEEGWETYRSRRKAERRRRLIEKYSVKTLRTPTREKYLRAGCLQEIAQLEEKPLAEPIEGVAYRAPYDGVTDELLEALHAAQEQHARRNGRRALPRARKTEMDEKSFENFLDKVVCDVDPPRDAEIKQLLRNRSDVVYLAALVENRIPHWPSKFKLPRADTDAVTLEASRERFVKTLGTKLLGAGRIPNGLSPLTYFALNRIVCRLALLWERIEHPFDIQPRTTEEDAIIALPPLTFSN